MYELVETFELCHLSVCLLCCGNLFIAWRSFFLPLSLSLSLPNAASEDFTARHYEFVCTCNSFVRPLFRSLSGCS